MLGGFKSIPEIWARNLQQISASGSKNCQNGFWLHKYKPKILYKKSHYPESLRM